MEVLVLRHAKAVDYADSDSNRKLTDKGAAQSAAVGRFCGNNGLAPDFILSSPIVRARQTADIVARELGRSDCVIECGALACGARPDAILREISLYDGATRVMVVGHQPDLGFFIESALGCENGEVEVKKATLTGLWMPNPGRMAASLLFHVPVRMMDS